MPHADRRHSSLLPRFGVDARIDINVEKSAAYFSRFVQVDIVKDPSFYVGVRNDFSWRWGLQRDKYGITRNDAVENIHEITGYSIGTSTEWVRKIEFGLVFVPLLYSKPQSDYVGITRAHCVFCHVTQDLLNEWSQYLPEGIDHKVVTPVDIHNVF